MRSRIYRWRRIRELRRMIDNEYVHIAEVQAALDRFSRNLAEASAVTGMSLVQAGSRPLDEAQRKAWRRISAYRSELAALGGGKHRRAR